LHEAGWPRAIITVALNKLDVDPKNARKTYSAEGIKELAATIGPTGTGSCRTSSSGGATRKAGIL